MPFLTDSFKPGRDLPGLDESLGLTKVNMPTQFWLTSCCCTFIHQFIHNLSVCEMVPWRQLWFWWEAPERANPPQNLGSSIDSRQQSTGLGIDVSIAPNGNYPFAHLSLSFLFLTCADHRSFLASFKVGAPAPRWQVKAGAGGGSWATYQSWSFWPVRKVGVIAVAFSFLQTTIINCDFGALLGPWVLHFCWWWWVRIENARGWIQWFYMVSEGFSIFRYF